MGNSAYRREISLEPDQGFHRVHVSRVAVMTSDADHGSIDPRIFHNKSFRLYKSNRAISTSFTNQQIQYIRLNVAKYVYKGVSTAGSAQIMSASDFLRGVSINYVSKTLEVTTSEETSDRDGPLKVSYLTVKQPAVGLRALLVFVTGEDKESRSVILMKNGMRQGLIASKDFDTFVVSLLQSMPSEDTEQTPLAIRALVLSSHYLNEVANNVLSMFRARSELAKLQNLELVFGRRNIRLRINDHLQNIAVSVPSEDLVELLRKPSDSPVETVLAFVSKTTTLQLSNLELVRLVTGPLSLSGDGGVRVSTAHSQLLPYVLSTLYSEL